MSEPEIARRCLACGASTLEHTSVCPECGQELEAEEDLRLSDADETVSVEAPSGVTDLPVGVASQAMQMTEQLGSSIPPRSGTGSL